MVNRFLEAEAEELKLKNRSWVCLEASNMSRYGSLVLSYLNNAIELDDDLTDDPAMEADSLVHGCAATCRGYYYD